jgi:hypothetical protein
MVMRDLWKSNKGEVDSRQLKVERKARGESRAGSQAPASENEEGGLEGRLA